MLMGCSTGAGEERAAECSTAPRRGPDSRKAAFRIAVVNIELLQACECCRTQGYAYRTQVVSLKCSEGQLENMWNYVSFHAMCLHIVTCDPLLSVGLAAIHFKTTMRTISWFCYGYLNRPWPLLDRVKNQFHTLNLRTLINGLYIVLLAFTFSVAQN